MAFMFLADRIRQTVGRLENLITACSSEVTSIVTADNVTWYSDIKSALSFSDFQSGDFWGGEDKNKLFSFNAVIPSCMSGKTVELVLTTGREGGWDATNPQFLAYVDGKLRQGMDINHRYIELSPKANAGDTFKVELIGWSGMLPGETFLKIELRAVNNCVRKLFYDIKTPYDLAILMDNGSRYRGEILEFLNTAVTMIDLREPGNNEFFTSIHNASEFMDTEFYGKYCGQANEATVTALGHTHIDVAWKWTLYQTEQKTLRSFSTALALMDKYPEYTFMSSQPQLYKYLKKRDPETYSRVKARIAEGRWEAEGAMWLEADCNVASGEALVRQVIHGKRFFRTEFNVDNKVLWLPDVFGYSAALPQILKKSGVDYFMTTKISWSETNKLPYDTFMWEGLDGTDILTSFVTTSSYPNGSKGNITTYVGTMTASEHLGVWDRYQHKDINNNVLNLYGFGDGGGGTTPEMIERAKRFKTGIPGTPKLEFGKGFDYFKQLESTMNKSKRLERWVGELYLELHRGTYTSQAKNKFFNRKCEYACETAEWTSILAGKLTDTAYPHEKIYDAWEEVLLLQFHDILPGSSIAEVYAQSDVQYQTVLDDMNGIINNDMHSIANAIYGGGDIVAVFNPCSFVRDDIVQISLPDGWQNAEVTTPEGIKCLSQLTFDGKLIFIASLVPSMGYRAFKLTKAAPETPLPIKYNGRVSSASAALTFDKNGRIISITDRVNNRELLKPGESAGLRTFYDIPRDWDNWEISAYYGEQKWDVDNLVSAEYIEHGAVRDICRMTYAYGRSTITQDITTFAHTGRIDFVTAVDWKEDNTLLKVVFPTDLHAVKATYDIQYGNVERTTHNNTSWDAAKFEVVAHKWADLSEADYGVSLLNDCKYGHHIKNGQMEITLIKSTGDPDPNMDRKLHGFTYSFFPHCGTWREAMTHNESLMLNRPLMAVTASGDGGSLPAEYSEVSVDTRNVACEVVKKAYDSGSTVLRLYEFEGARAKTHLSLSEPAMSAAETDLLEENAVPLELDGDSLAITMKPYEIKTIVLKRR